MDVKDIYLEMSGITKSFPGVRALDGVDFSLCRNEIHALVGENGAGKSTLMNMLGGNLKPDQGVIRLDGKPVTIAGPIESLRMGIGFVHQESNLLPNLTAVENVAMPLMFQGMPKNKREAIAKKMLKRVGLGKRMNHYPTQMSGGQQQRVGIARAFASRPQVVFADEPTGNLDSKTKNDVMDMICAFARDLNQTIVLVTHDDNMAQYADRIVTLLDGRIIDDRLVNNA